MPKKRLNLRISEEDIHKLRLYALSKNKTMTGVIEDCIASIKKSDIEKVEKFLGLDNSKNKNKED